MEFSLRLPQVLRRDDLNFVTDLDFHHTGPDWLLHPEQNWLLQYDDKRTQAGRNPSMTKRLERHNPATARSHRVNTPNVFCQWLNGGVRKNA